MTSDRARKKAARAQQAATGQPYMQAWRSVQRQAGASAEPAEPPPIDPRTHAVHAQQWGDQDHYLVLYQGRYYTWITTLSVDGRAMVHRVPSEEVGRQLVDEWQTVNILGVPWDETIEHIFVMDPDADKQISYEATVADVEGAGLWLACRDRTVTGQTRYVLERFTDLEPALAAFADQADTAAGQAGRNQALSMPDVLAGVLRYRAAKTRANVARARLGDAIRAQGGPVHELSTALQVAGANWETVPAHRRALLRRRRHPRNPGRHRGRVPVREHLAQALLHHVVQPTGPPATELGWVTWHSGRLRGACCRKVFPNQEYTHTAETHGAGVAPGVGVGQL